MPPKISHRDLEDADAEGEAKSIWLISLADMFSILMVFFVMLYAVSTTSKPQFMGVISKIGDALGGKSLTERKFTMEKVVEKVDKLIQDSNLVSQVQLTSDTRGLVLFAEGDLFFEAASADLKKDVKFFLRHIAKIILETNYKVLVEGHTDDTPTSTEKFPSNWELSAARAISVVRYLVDEEGIEPSRFSIVAYAGYKPRYAVTPDNRSKNRRVELVITRETM